MTTTADGVGPTLLRARHYDLGTFRVLELAGECDLATSEEFRTELADALAAEPVALIVDLTRVGFCDSNCAWRILDAAHHARLAAVGLGGVAGLVFDLLDPTEDLPRNRTVADAAWRLAEI